jgi:hypothetical protein
MLLSQFLTFPLAEQSKILSTVGFTRTKLLAIMQRHLKLLDDNGIDIIFGWEPTKGKIYLNASDGYMVSYRTDESMKLYIPYLGDDSILAVYSGEELVCFHRRTGAKWTAYDLNGRVLHQYWRPVPEYILMFFDLFF